MPPGLGIALRAEPAWREFARGASLSSFSSPAPPPSPPTDRPPRPISLPNPVSPPAIPPRSSYVLSARFCGNPSGTFSYRCYSATCRIRRFPTADRNNSACCFRSACLSNGTASSESHGTFLNTFANIVASQRPDANTLSEYLTKKNSSIVYSFHARNRIKSRIIVFTAKIFFSCCLLCPELCALKIGD